MKLNPELIVAKLRDTEVVLNAWRDPATRGGWDDQAAEWTANARSNSDCGIKVIRAY